MSEENQNNKDLNDLLDSALKDFDKSTTTGSADATNTEGEAKNDAQDDPDKFLIDQTQLLAERMSMLFGVSDTDGDNIQALSENSFKKIAEAAVMTLEGENPANDEEVAKYSDIIAQALSGLQEGSENLSSAENISDMFAGLNVFDSNEGGEEAFLPLMEGMMQSLLSAEVLLPSIKELLEKYPKYLEENADKLSAEDKDRYEKQMDLYKVVEGHLESQSPNDTPAVKREKFRLVLQDMRKFQEYGLPPAEIQDLPNFDQTTLSGAGGASSPQCPMM